MQLKKITSPQNEQIKFFNKAKKNSSQYFWLEGVRLVEMFFASPSQKQFQPVQIFFTTEILKNPRVQTLFEKNFSSCACFEISSELYKKLSSEEQNPQGILLLVKKQNDEQFFPKLPKNFQKNFRMVVLDGVQDPGNAGNILRTAEAFGMNHIVTLKGTINLFNQKVLRSAMGAHFFLETILENISAENFLAYLKKNSLPCFATALDPNAAPYFKIQFPQACAIIFGNEGNGISSQLLNEPSLQKIFIPMSGHAESLNVASSAAILLSEMMRQQKNA